MLEILLFTIFYTSHIPSIPSHNEAWKAFKKKGIHFGHLNVNSFLSKIEELRILAFHTIISLLRITEIEHWNTVRNEELKIDGYNLVWSDRNKTGGGVACYINNNIGHNRQSIIF